MTSHIQTPVEGYTGIVVGVSFAHGVGHTGDAPALAYFERHNYDVASSCPPDCESAPATGGDEGKELTPKQKLQAEAKELGLDEAGTAEELKARIAEHKEKTAQDPGKGDGGDEGKEQG